MIARLRRACASTLLGLAAVAGLHAPAAAQTPGRIFATDRFGGPQLLFNGAGRVHLAGGPAPEGACGDPGLADGEYVFQVTDPAGAELLSPDPIEARRVLVSGGVLAGTPPGGHATLPGPCSSVLVKLEPLLAPAAGTEYRVWLTPLAEYSPGQGFHGFRADRSKTASFRIEPFLPYPPITVVRGVVYYDFDDDGVNEAGAQPGEVVIAGWKLRLDGGLLPVDTFTDMDGRYTFLPDADGLPRVLTSIAPAPGYVGTPGGRWEATTPTPVELLTGPPEVVTDFGKLFFVNTPELARSKGYWHRQGELDLLACDPQWRELLNTLCLRTNFSNPDGQEGTVFRVHPRAPFAAAYGSLSDYLTSPSYGVLAHQLSVQFAAANLNRSCGALQLPTYVDRFFDDVLVEFEVMAADTQALLCNPCSANTGPMGDPDCRAMIMMCLMEWDDMNSTGSNVFTRGPEGDGFQSPY